MPIITLSTDLGTKDYLVASIKGLLLRKIPQVQIIDVTHQLSSDNYIQTAYICSNSIQHFPDKTIHFILNNVFEYSPTQILIAEYKNQYIICANNGLLPMITNKLPEKIYSVNHPVTQNVSLLQFAETAIEFASKIIQQENLTNFKIENKNIIIKNNLQPAIYDNYIEGHIIFIDNHENVVVNITREIFESARKNRPFKIVFQRQEIIDTLNINYEARDSDKIAYFNSANFLEIAVINGNAASLFGLSNLSDNLEKSMEQIIQSMQYYQKVFIYFE
jgi:S-adenosylmethionine hydrolase